MKAKPHRFFFWRMRWQLLALVAVVLVPALLVQLGVYVNWYRTRSAAELDANLELARSMATLFSAFAGEAARDSLTLGLSVLELKQHASDQVPELLRVSEAENPQVDRYHWADPQGTITASSDPKAVGVQVGDRAYFRQILEGRKWSVSELITDRVTGKKVLIIARAIHAADGALGGVLLASIDLTQLDSVFASIRRSEGGRISLYDQLGNLVFMHPAPPNLSEANWARQDPLLASARAGSEAKGRLVSPIDGSNRLTARVPVAGIGWAAGAGRDAGVVLAPLLRTLAEALGLALVVAVLSAMLALLLTRRIVGNLQLLENYVATLGKGDLSHRIEIPGVPEFGTLAEAANQMAADLQQAQEALRQANAELEGRVEERTAGLRAANASLVEQIHERERAQQALWEQSRILEAFYEHSMTPLAFLDRNFNFIRVNEAYARACQRAVTDFPGHNHFELYPSEELEGRFRTVVQTKEPYHVFARPFAFPDHPEWGVSYWNLSVVPLLDAAGEVEFVVFSLEDVTQRKVAEERAQVISLIQALFTTKTSRKDYLDAVVQVLSNWAGCENVGIRVVNEERRVPYEAWIGFTPEFMQIESDLSLDSDTSACTRVIRGTPEPQEASAMTPYGSFWCEDAPKWIAGLTPQQRACYRGTCAAIGFASLAVVPILYGKTPLGAIHLADKRPGLMSLSMVEFLESIAALIGEAVHRFSVEEALRRAHAELEQRVQERTAQLQAANEQLQREIDERERIQKQMQILARFPMENPHPVLRIAQDQILVYCNVAGKPLLELWNCHVGSRAPEEIQQRVAAALSSGATSTMELDAGNRTFWMVFAPVIEFGYVNVYASDVTERKLAEEALQRTAEELARSNRDLEQFAYVASHDLQEPLRMITGYVQLIERRYKDKLDKDAEEFIAFAVDGCARMQTLIADLLAYSRVGMRGRTFERTDCRQALDRALANLRTAIQENDAVVATKELPTLLADKTQLVQLFQNLLSNAIKFRSPERRLHIEIGARDEGGDWVFWVRDNGIGMEPQYGERIFVIFQRLHGRTEYPGTGIGLAICKKIVERHGGRIWVESELEKGAAFFFTIKKED